MPTIPQGLIFNVPAGAGAYAPEILYLGANSDPLHLDAVDQLVITVLGVPPAAGQAEVDVLKQGSDPLVAGSWQLNIATANAVGIYDPLHLGGQRARIRFKSGGVAGAIGLNASYTVSL